MEYRKKDGRKAVDSYIHSASPPAQAILKAIRKKIHKYAPRAKEHIARGMPTFSDGTASISIGALANAVGFYVPHKALKAGERKLAKYISETGKIHFPYGTSLPIGAINSVIKKTFGNKYRKKRPDDEDYSEPDPEAYIESL